MELVSDNPLLKKAWKKYNKPIFKSTEGIIGPGHCSFTIKREKDNIERYMIFHSFNDRNDLTLTNVNARYIKINLKNGTLQFND